jgi:chloramphenicol O-acetyltransferase
LEEIYGAKIHELETQLDMETKNFEETTLQYNEEFDKFKKEGQNYVEQLTFEMERKVKGLEERVKASEMIKRVPVSSFRI